MSTSCRDRPRGPDAIPLPDAFAPYKWAATVEEVAARHGLAPAEVLKFDQNTPPLPGRRRRFRSRRASRRWTSTRTASTGSFERPRPATWTRLGTMSAGSRSSSERARTTSSCSARAPSSGRVAPRRWSRRPTRSTAIVTLLSGADPVAETEGASLIWRCNPENPTGEVTPAPSSSSSRGRTRPRP